MAIDRTQRKEWAREHFWGCENITLPSFTPDLTELDEEGIRLDVRQGISHGAFSTLCSIESGLTIEEKKRFVEIVADEAGDGMCVGVALCGDSLEENIELLQHGERVGASHAMVSYPHNFAPESEEDIYRYNRELLDASDLGIVLFHNDKFGFHRFHPSGVPFEAFDRLVDLDNAVAMKVSGPDLAMVAECFDRYGDRVLCSVPTIVQFPIVMPQYEMQFTGAWTIEAFQTPEQPLVVEMMRLFQQGKAPQAMELFGRLGPLFAVVGPRLMTMMPTGIYHWTLFKYFQWLSGGNGGPTRQPAMRLTAADMREVRAAYRACGFEVVGDADEEFWAGRAARDREAAVR